MLTRRIARFPEFGIMPQFMPQMDRFVDTLLAGADAGLAAPAVAPVFPAMNVFEDDQAVVVEAELPGFTMNNLEISVLGHDLTIAGNREWSAPEGSTVHRRERTGSARFSRSLRIGTPIDPDKITARLEAGVLTVTLPKAESAKPRKIQIKSA